VHWGEHKLQLFIVVLKKYIKFVEQAYKGSEHVLRRESNTQLFEQEIQKVGSDPHDLHAAINKILKFIFKQNKKYLPLQREPSFNKQFPDIDVVLSSHYDIHFPDEKISQG